MDASFYQRNRAKLLASVTDDALVVLTAYTQMQWSADQAAPFRQEANFYWLTGITEPDWLVVFSSTECVMIAPEIDATRQVFEGGLTHDEAIRISGADRVIVWSEADAYVTEHIQQKLAVHLLEKEPYQEHYDFVVNPATERLAKKLKKQTKETVDIRPVLLKLRAIKSDEEIAVIKKAVDVTVESFEKVKRQLAGYHSEYEVEADINAGFRRLGSDGYAYQSIVAGGQHACTLHYVENKSPLDDGTGLLIDAGAQWQGYAADITRTYAVGEPSQRFRDIHAAVEKAHQYIIELIKPDVAIKTYIERVDEIMKQALQSLDLLNTEDDYRHYFPHAISHGLGLDVHESLGGYKTFQPGMVLTVEPGIYVPEEKIGVRIEDDILVTEQGNENLSGRLSMGL